jgi:hypothetical protein
MMNGEKGCGQVKVCEGDAEIFLSGGNEITNETRGQAKLASESLSAVLPAVSGHRLLFAFSPTKLTNGLIELFRFTVAGWIYRRKDGPKTKRDSKLMSEIRTFLMQHKLHCAMR